MSNSTSNSLGDWQRAFRDALVTGSVPTNLDLPLHSTEDFPREERLGVYQYAYYARLIEILAKDFSEVKQRAGEDRFEDLAKSYLIEFPSISFALFSLGEKF